MTLRPAVLPPGESKLGVRFAVEGAAPVPFNLTVWMFGQREEVTPSTSLKEP
ncbi:MAG TPA: hypothetical protein VN829_08550 [Dongiaceae bacterium]|nr:hypothetical protein [Dongiaceae bacterium]